MINSPLQNWYRKLFKPGILRKWQANQRVLPDFIVIGAMRAGTTSLNEWIAGHSKVMRAIKKEIHYFDLFYDKGPDWYRAHFPLKSKMLRSKGITGEASPYYIFHPLAPSRILDLVPDVKLIAILRNPIDRAYSHYWHSIRLKAENLSFEDAIDREAQRLSGEEEKLVNIQGYASKSHLHFSYLHRSIYSEQLRRWRACFPKDQLLVLEHGLFFKYQAEQSSRLFDFLGVAPEQISLRKPMNKAAYPAMAPKTRERLLEFFEPHNADLFEMLGESFDWQD